VPVLPIGKARKLKSYRGLDSRPVKMSSRITKVSETANLEAASVQICVKQWSRIQAIGMVCTFRWGRIRMPDIAKSRRRGM